MPASACPSSQTLLAVVIFYLVLGCFMETLSMMITTIPIVAPVMFALGFDPIWFGIVLVILIEMALITPPVGLNLFVVQSLRTRGTLNDVMIGVEPIRRRDAVDDRAARAVPRGSRCGCQAYSADRYRCFPDLNQIPEVRLADIRTIREGAT